MAIKLERIENFEKLGFGIFVHYGLYSQLNKGEWAWWYGKMEREEYLKTFDTFSAENFDADGLAKLAKKAGAKYIVFTTRHHDGFSLYDTRGLNEYDSIHAPCCGRDLVKEFVDACRANDIIPFLYHTTWDWYQKDFNENFPAYLKYLQDSVEIICKYYGEIGGFWFDGNWINPSADWKEDDLYGMIRKYQPNAILVNNAGMSARGEVRHKELDVMEFERGKAVFIDQSERERVLASESCDSVFMHWATANDLDYKSPRMLIEALVDSKKVGANYLLNIGPKAAGEICKMEEALLEKIGEWVDVYREAFFGTETLQEHVKEDYFLTRGEKDDYLFVKGLYVIGDKHVMLYDENVKKITLSGIQRKIKRISWMDNGEELLFSQENGEVQITATQFFYGTHLIVRVARIEYADE